MNSGEMISGGHESAEEGSRKIVQVRGKKAETSAREAMIQEILEERARLQAEYEALQREKMEIMGRLADKGGKEPITDDTVGAVKNDTDVVEGADAVTDVIADGIEMYDYDVSKPILAEVIDYGPDETADGSADKPDGGVETGTGEPEAEPVGEPVAESETDSEESEPGKADSGEVSDSSRLGEAVASTGERPSEAEIAETVKKAKKHGSFRAFLAGLAMTALATVIGVGVVSSGSYGQRKAPSKETVVEYFDSATLSPTSAPEAPDLALDYGDASTAVAGGEGIDALVGGQELANSLVGEQSNGTTYDYTHYADREHKEAYNAFDYDMSAAFENRGETEEGIMGVARRAPEALASYAEALFIDQEKQELGIAGMTSVEIDDYVSKKEDGGAMQKRLLEKLESVLKDGSTTYEYYHENGTEKTYYIYFVDENGDMVMTPDEMHLGYDTRTRNNAPQVDIYRSFTDSNGVYHENVKMGDLNMLCGYQLNYVQAPTGVPFIPADNVPEVTVEIKDTPTPETPTPETPTPIPETPTPTPPPDTPTPTPTPDTPTPPPDTPTPTPTPDTPTPPPDTPTPTPTPDTPTPPPDTPTPTPTPVVHPPKNEQAEEDYAGEYVEPMTVDWTKTNTEAEHEVQEAVNRESVQQQEREDAEAEKRAEEIANIQADAEKEAEAVIEERQEQQQEQYNSLSPEQKVAEDMARAAADEAMAKNENEVSERRQSVNEVTSRVRQDIEDRQQAQDVANAVADTQTIIGQTEAENGTLNGDDFANIASQMGFK